MKKFLMVILMAAAAMVAAPHASAMDAAPVDPVVAGATVFVDHLALAPAQRLEQRSTLNIALRAQGYQPVHDDKACLSMLALMQKYAVGASRDEKIAALTLFLKKPAPSFWRKNAGKIAALVGVGGLVAADMGWLGDRLCIGKAGELDAPAAFIETWRAYAPVWAGGTPDVHPCDLGSAEGPLTASCSVPGRYYGDDEVVVHPCDLGGAEGPLTASCSVPGRYYGDDEVGAQFGCGPFHDEYACCTNNGTKAPCAPLPSGAMQTRLDDELARDGSHPTYYVRWLLGLEQ